jgi:phosphoribosylamine--glycine ligase
VRILILGSGAREHALVWALARHEAARDLVCAPGNAALASTVRCEPIDATRPEAVLALATAERIDLTVVGPEAPLAQGVADLFRAHGRRIFGPTRAAARLETSKAFAKDFMCRHGVPTARYRVCGSPDEARAVIRSGELGESLVVKADGLAAGKGVVVADDRRAAEAAVEAAMIARRFGDAGARVVLEERLVGPEVSFFVIADGERRLPLVSAQDHKRLLDDDLGPNTGGMGAFAPSPLVDDGLAARIGREVVDPVLGGCARRERPFRASSTAG